MVIASWILGIEPSGRDAARSAVAAIPEARLGDSHDPLVVTTECPDDELARMQQALAAAPGVLTVSMVVAYRDRDGESA